MPNTSKHGSLGYVGEVDFAEFKSTTEFHLSEITLTQYERQAMFKIPDASGDPLPKCTRNPVEICGTMIVVMDARNVTEPIDVCSTLPFVAKGEPDADRYLS